MTLNDIISSSLTMLERGADAQTIDHYRAQFTKYANDAVFELARRFKQQRRETVALMDGTFDVAQLSRECLRVTQVLVDGKPVLYRQNPWGSGVFRVAASGAEEAEVHYRFVPRDMESSTDVPELPAYMHRLIPYYVAACQRCGGDPDTQGTSSAHFALFNSMVSNLQRETRGEPQSFRLLHY